MLPTRRTYCQGKDHLFIAEMFDRWRNDTIHQKDLGDSLDENPDWVDEN